MCGSDCILSAQDTDDLRRAVIRASKLCLDLDNIDVPQRRSKGSITLEVRRLRGLVHDSLIGMLTLLDQCPSWVEWAHSPASEKAIAESGRTRMVS